MSDKESNESRETVADIVAAMRAMSRVSETFVDRFSNPCLRMEMEMEAKMRKHLADRIEAAAKRENAQPGNVAAMREALKEARRVLREIYKPELSPLDGDNRLISATVGIINAALSAPPRNCDVGTAEEQFKRYLAFCHSESRGCGHCPADRTRLRGTSNCDLAWAQMPCGAERKGEGDGR